jgi:hypothetical protein
LEAYFEGERAKERILVTIAKGAYVPAFVERDEEAEAVGGRRTWIWVAVALVLGVGLSIFSWVRWSAGNGLAKQFWVKMLGGSKPTLIVAGDTSLVLLQDITLQKVRLAEYLSGEYRMKLKPPDGMNEELLRRIGRRRYTGIVDASVAAKLSQRTEGKPVVRFARDLRFGEVKGSNLILLGAPHANPWLELYEKDMNFWLDLDLAKANFVVLNRRPQQGEQARYETNQSDPRQPIWAVISYLPNGPQGEVLILAGASVAGTEAAAEFLLDDKRMEEFFRKSPSGKVGYFNLLLETIAVDGNSPSSRPVAWRFL